MTALTEAGCRSLIASPQDAASRPLLRRYAWARLMAARGCRFDWGRIAAEARRIEALRGLPEGRG